MKKVVLKKMMIGAVLFICLFFIYMFFLIRIKHSYRMDVIAFVLFAVFLAIVVFHSIPVYDLYQHYLFVKTIQVSGANYIELIISPPLGWEHNRFYLVFDLLCYFNAKIGIFNLLPAFMVMIDYLIFGYISVDWHRKNFLYKGYFISIMISFAFMPFLHAAAGMRNAAAISVAALGIYLYFEKKASCIVFAVLVLLGLLIHPAVIIILPSVFLAGKKMNYKNILFVFIIILSLHKIAIVCTLSSFSFIRMLGNAYLRYSSAEQYVSSRRYLFFDIICIFIFLFCLFMSWKQKKEHTRLERFFIYYMIFILGNIGNYDLVIRPSYLFAPLAGPLITTVYEGSWNIKRRQEVVLKKLSLLFLIIGAVFLISDYMGIYVNEYF